MWHKVDKEKGFNYDELLKLYQIIDIRERGFREDLFRFTNFYSAVCFAILGITLSGFISLFEKGPIMISLVFGPVLAIFMCFLGLRVTGQIMRRIQEETSAKAKVENILGLDQPILVKEFLSEKVVWQDDISVIPTRHAVRRFSEATSAKFVDAGSHRKGGVNANNKLYFGMIGFFSLLLGIAIVFVYLTK